MRYFLFSLLTLTIFWSQRSYIANSSKSKMCMHLANKLVGAVIQEEELHGGLPDLATMETLSEQIKSFDHFQVELSCEDAFAHSGSYFSKNEYRQHLQILSAIKTSYAQISSTPFSVAAKGKLLK